VKYELNYKVNNFRFEGDEEELKISLFFDRTSVNGCSSKSVRLLK